MQLSATFYPAASSLCDVKHGPSESHKAATGGFVHRMVLRVPVDGKSLTAICMTGNRGTAPNEQIQRVAIVGLGKNEAGAVKKINGKWHLFHLDSAACLFRGGRFIRDREVAAYVVCAGSTHPSATYMHDGEPDAARDASVEHDDEPNVVVLCQDSVLMDKHGILTPFDSSTAHRRGIAWAEEDEPAAARATPFPQLSAVRLQVKLDDTLSTVDAQWVGGGRPVPVAQKGTATASISRDHVAVVFRYEGHYYMQRTLRSSLAELHRTDPLQHEAIDQDEQAVMYVHEASTDLDLLTAQTFLSRTPRLPLADTHGVYLHVDGTVRTFDMSTATAAGAVSASSTPSAAAKPVSEPGAPVAESTQRDSERVASAPLWELDAVKLAAEIPDAAHMHAEATDPEDLPLARSMARPARRIRPNPPATLASPEAV